MVACYWSYYKVCAADPGYITPKNHSSHLTRFEYDNLLNAPSQQCKKCAFDKVARSRHCHACKHCIARFDHHCVWINSCVGLHNYKYFLTFLALHALLTLYGALAGTLIMLADTEPLFEKRYYTNNSLVTGHLPSVFADMIDQHPAFISVVLLCYFVALLTVNFFIYHLYLIRTGLTTYERFKHGEIYFDAKESVTFF